jgi:hypothetical protein
MTIVLDCSAAVEIIFKRPKALQLRNLGGNLLWLQAQ